MTAKTKRFLRLLSASALLTGGSLYHGHAAPAGAHDYPFQPVPFTAVHLDDGFWAPRLETNRVTTIPYAFGKCEESGRMNNFERAAAILRGETSPTASRRAIRSTTPILTKCWKARPTRWPSSPTRKLSSLSRRA